MVVACLVLYHWSGDTPLLHAALLASSLTRPGAFQLPSPDIVSSLCNIYVKATSFLIHPFPFSLNWRTILVLRLWITCSMLPGSGGGEKKRKKVAVRRKPKNWKICCSVLMIWVGLFDLFIYLFISPQNQAPTSSAMQKYKMVAPIQCQRIIPRGVCFPVSPWRLKSLHSL